MKIYEETIFPLINNLLTSSFINHRKKVLKNVSGDVLEIGFGTGLSLPAYTDKVDKIIGLEPNKGMLSKVIEYPRLNVEIVEGHAEKLPFDDNRFNAVVSFLTLCTVSDLEKSLQEMKRVLKTGGKLYFIEHVAQPKNSYTRKIQNLLRPLWIKLACGCVLNRETTVLLEKTGFQITESKVIGYSGFPNFLGPVIRGAAVIAK